MSDFDLMMDAVELGDTVERSTDGGATWTPCYRIDSVWQASDAIQRMLRAVGHWRITRDGLQLIAVTTTPVQTYHQVARLCD